MAQSVLPSKDAEIPLEMSKDPHSFQVGNHTFIYANTKEEIVDFAEYLEEKEVLSTKRQYTYTDPNSKLFCPSETFKQKLDRLRSRVSATYPDKTLSNFNKDNLDIKIENDQPVWIGCCSCRGLIRSTFADVKHRELLKLRLGIQIRWTQENPEKMRLVFLIRALEVVPPFPKQEDLAPPPYMAPSS